MSNLVIVPEGTETVWFAEQVALHQTPETLLVRFTPAIAKVFLGADTHNRDVRPGRVAQMTEDVAEGRWQVNGEALKVSRTGVLLDGGHRSRATVAADKYIDTMITFGLDDDAQESMDDVDPRKLKDDFKRNGVGDSKNRATLTGLVMQYERYGRLFTTGSYQPSLRSKILRARELAPELDEALEAVPREERPVVPVPKLAAFYIILRRLGANKDDVVTFMHQLIVGEMLPAGSPILAARNWLMKAKAVKGRTVTVTEYFELLARTWNAHIIGEQRTVMKLVGGGMPELLTEAPSPQQQQQQQQAND